MLVALLIVAAVPAVAMAQSAGQDQYSDPLQNDGSSGGSNNSGSGGNSGSSNSQATPAQSTPQSSAPAATTTPSTTAAQSSTKALPRTGYPVGFLILSGAALLASGIALRRRVLS